jgi:phospholipid/cholesterol/gamma-HCH transport system ATP-binding protein
MSRSRISRDFVDGADMLDDWKLVPFRRKFGMVFQFGALFDSMSVFDNVAFPLREHTKMRARRCATA